METFAATTSPPETPPDADDPDEEVPEDVANNPSTDVLIEVEKPLKETAPLAGSTDPSEKEKESGEMGDTLGKYKGHNGAAPLFQKNYYNVSHDTSHFPQSS